MTRPAFLAVASIVALSACACAGGAAASRPSARFLAARLLVDAAVEPIERGPAHAAKAPPKGLSPDQAVGAAPPPPASVDAAMRAAIREPEADYYVGAAQIYPCTEGAIYRLYTAPGQVSDIALQPGEALVSVAAGDTARWVIGDTASGSGATRRVHILVKPTSVGLTTNLVIATDRRVYHVDVKSNARTAMASISWTYPEDALMALKAAASAAPAERVAAGVAVEALNFNYRIDGDNPPWRPLRAFDDGRQAFIEFPPSLAQGEAPPLFIIGEGGRAELVNYRLKGRYYVVDRLFAAAELRLGEKHQQVVRIVRDEPGGRRGRSGS